MDAADLLAVQEKSKGGRSWRFGGIDNGVDVHGREWRAGYEEIIAQAKGDIQRLEGSQHEAELYARLAMLKSTDPLAAHPDPIGDGGLIQSKRFAASPNGRS